MEFLFDFHGLKYSGLAGDARLARIRRENELKKLLGENANFKVSFKNWLKVRIRLRSSFIFISI